MKESISTKALEFEMEKLITMYSKMESVDCIYFIPYVDNKGNVFELTLVFNVSNIKDELDELIEKLNDEYSEIEDKIGGTIKVVTDRSSEYGLIGMHKREKIRIADLASSTIIKDRDGVYSHIAEHNLEKGYVKKYDNIIDMNINYKKDSPKSLNITLNNNGEV